MRRRDSVGIGLGVRVSRALPLRGEARDVSGDRLQLAKAAFLFIEPSTLRALAEVAP